MSLEGDLLGRIFDDVQMQWEYRRTKVPRACEQ
jgi:hypothetical protein